MSLQDLSEVASFEEPVPEPAPTLPIGTVIGGKYRIKKLLGSGGNGAVYEGEHTAVGHRVAIKVAHPKARDREAALARFRREARICGTLRHPNIGQVYDVGMLEDDSPYMVMELQEGRSLGEVLDETKLPIAAIIDITCQLLAGLGAAHRAGSIHRDVKPDNVMIVRDHDGEVVVKLVDFGISKSIGPRDGDVTDEGVIIGSPDYMAPEQLRGDEVDVRTDLYSAGVLLYEAITNQLPFDVENLADLVATILRDPPRPPSVQRPDCPPELEHIVLKAMSRDPKQRYESAEDMSRALLVLRAATRTMSSASLANLSTPPAAKSAMVRKRRRTIDSRTIEDLRAQLGDALVPRKSKMWLIALAASVSGALLLAWFWSAGPVETPERVSSTPIAVSPAAAPAAMPEAQAVPASAPAPAPAVVAPPPVVANPPRAASEAAKPDPAPNENTAATNAQRMATKPASRPEPRIAEPRVSEPRAPAQDIQPLLKQATSSFALGQTEQALTLYRSVVKAAPREAAAWRGLGVAANKLGQRAEAARAFSRYLALSPNAPDAARVKQQLDNLQ